MSDELDDLLQQGPMTINVGVQDFASSLQAQGAQVVHVQWSPPAEGDPEMQELLDQLL